MAYTVKENRSGPATQVREDLSRAERLSVQIDRNNVEGFLRLLDEIEDLLERLEQGGLDVRSERVRQQSLMHKVEGDAGPIVAAAGGAGGMERLRAANPPAESFWWHLDAVVAERRRHTLRRLGTGLGILIAALVAIYVLVTYVFPPDPDVVMASDALSTLQDLALEGRWEEALAVVEQTRAQMSKDDVELLLWEGVLAAKLGRDQQSETALARAREMVPPENEAVYWSTLGNVRLAVGELDAAVAAAEEAIALNPDEPQAYFLLGSVAETRGDVGAAIDHFQQTFDLAVDSNPQLAVIAKVRQGTLLQRGPAVDTSSTITATP